MSGKTEDELRNAPAKTPRDKYWLSSKENTVPELVTAVIVALHAPRAKRPRCHYIGGESYSAAAHAPRYYCHIKWVRSILSMPIGRPQPWGASRIGKVPLRALGTK